MLVYAEFCKSRFYVGEILSRCRCGPSVKCVVYIGQRERKRGKIVPFAFFLGGGNGGNKEEESYCCSWGWKAWIWACFILNMWKSYYDIFWFWQKMSKLCYSKWSCRVTKKDCIEKCIENSVIFSCHREWLCRDLSSQITQSTPFPLLWKCEKRNVQRR